MTLDPEKAPKTPVTTEAEKLGLLKEQTNKGVQKAEKIVEGVDKMIKNLTPAQLAGLGLAAIFVIESSTSGNKKSKEKEKTDEEIGKENKPTESATESKKEQPRKAPADDTREDLRKLAETCPVLPVIPPKLMDQIKQEIRGTRKGIVRAVEIAVKNSIKGDHCWDWADKIYHMAGCKRRVIFNAVPMYASKKYEIINGKKAYKKIPDCGTHHAYDKEYAQLEQGDHIFINNKNQTDNHGNHSEIFLGWVDRTRLIARTAGYPGKGNPPYISSRRNFNKTPITYIAKPLPRDKNAPLVA